MLKRTRNDSGCDSCSNIASDHMPLTRNLLLAAPLLLLPTGALHAQVLSGYDAAKGGGTLQTCDTSMHVDFTIGYQDGYDCLFNPDVQPGSTTVTGAQWDYYHYGSSAWVTDYAGSPTVPYSSPQPYPMCYTVEAFDQMASQPCITTVCKLVAPQAYAICAGLAPNFGILAVDGSMITFENLSLFPGGSVAEAYWEFGDGSSIATASSPSHDFSGPGPFEVCLTVVGAAPTYCTATLCQWLYLGPSGMPCEEVVDQGFVVLQYENLVGVMDTSRTTGMNAGYSWDFGDGAVATGRIAAHAYVPFQSYEICGTLRVWGPLLSDTCASTLCREVTILPAVGLAEQAEGQAPLAWPSPFTEVLHIGASSTPRRLALIDGGGRTVMETGLPASPASRPLHVGHLSAGSYLLILEDERGRFAQRLVKQP